jgi:hypothetical protein
MDLAFNRFFLSAHVETVSVEWYPVNSCPGYVSEILFAGTGTNGGYGLN